MSESGQYLLAIDAGTGSCRAVLFDTSGRQVAMAQHEWSHLPEAAYPGSQVFETRANWQHICACIRQCIRQMLATSGVEPTDIAGVSSTSMREGIVLFDKQGQEIWACPNVDSRAGEEAAELVNRKLAEKIYFTGGDWVAITTPPRLLWLQKHEPQIFARIAHLTMLSDWILFKLCGEYVTDPSAGSSSGMFDLARSEWSQEIVQMCGLNTDVLPPVRASGTMIGRVHRQAAAETGLAEGTPVVVGGADTQLGLVGIGQVEPGQFTIVGGTFWQHTVGVEQPLIDPQSRLRTLCHAIPGQWMLEGIGFYSGLTMRWFRDAFCDLELEQSRRSGQDPYALMEQLALQVPPGSNGVIGIFSNIMNARRWIHASPGLLQFNIENPSSSGRKESIRAIEESAAYVCYGHMKIIEELTNSTFHDIVFTGGASKGVLWPQVLAHMLNCRVRVPVVKESTALGAALYAGLGAGIFDDLRSVSKQIVRFEKTYEPDPAIHRVYRELYEQWLLVYQRSLSMVEEGLVRPLWRAAGT
ncbi:MAG TPA: autoinducer-2 kinase [Ktedonobacteraceae bacterium]|nr:autoinducer-2 kinase [Ktedonobacteraceae bacterium]